MYSTSPAIGTSIAAGGSLAATGANLVWLTLGGFALMSAGLAVLRVLARKEA